MSDYLDSFLEKYCDNVEDLSVLSYVLYLLPYSYQFVFVRNLLKFSDFVCEGDLMGGVAPVGLIRVGFDGIYLYNDDLDGGFVCLVEFPPLYEF